MLQEGRGGKVVATPPLGVCGVDLQDEVNIMGNSAAGIRDDIQNGRQDGRHLGFINKLKFFGKTRKLQLFFAGTVK